MSSYTNEEVIRRFMEAMNNGNIDALDDIFSANYIQHSPDVPPGREGSKQFLTALVNAFPDGRYTLDDVISSGDKAVARWTFRATHTGELMGIPPTGNKVEISGIDIVRIEDGQYAEHWDNWDQLGLMRQLGVIPTPPRAG